MLFNRNIIIFLLFLITPLGLSSTSFANTNLKETAQTVLFERLKQGQVVAIMRHSLAPGTGDPDNFELGQCNTQRNLSVEGKKQANEIGELFRSNGIDVADIYSSEWCRCVDTADGLKLGQIKTLPTLNSFFQFYSKEPQQTQDLKIWLGSEKSSKPVILVSHQVNITALTGVFPSSGEIVFIRVEPSGAIVVEGSIKT